MVEADFEPGVEADVDIPDDGLIEKERSKVAVKLVKVQVKEKEREEKRLAREQKREERKKETEERQQKA